MVWHPGDIVQKNSTELTYRLIRPLSLSEWEAINEDTGIFTKVSPETHYLLESNYETTSPQNEEKTPFEPGDIVKFKHSSKYLYRVTEENSSSGVFGIRLNEDRSARCSGEIYIGRRARLELVEKHKQEELKEGDIAERTGHDTFYKLITKMDDEWLTLSIADGGFVRILERQLKRVDMNPEFNYVPSPRSSTKYHQENLVEFRNFNRAKTMERARQLLDERKAEREAYDEHRVAGAKKLAKALAEDPTLNESQFLERHRNKFEGAKPETYTINDLEQFIEQLELLEDDTVRLRHDELRLLKLNT